MENAKIADIFDEIADLLELQEADQFRIRSYRNAARTVRDMTERLEDLVNEDKDLSKLPNIGKSTAEKIVEIVKTGTCQRLQEQQRNVPRELIDLMKIPGLGPKKAMQVFKELNVKSLADLEKACKDHKLRDLKGLGEKTEQNILEGIKMVKGATGRHLYKAAAEYVQSISRHLGKLDSVERFEVAGSFRRRLETVGDLDILIRAKDRDKAVEDIVKYESIDKVLGKGKERVTVRLDNGLQVDFRFFEDENFGSAMMYFTGSKAHNIALRKIALDRDWKLNEYGLFKGDNRLAGKDEESVYARLNLPWIAPELREDRGEIQAASEGKLPKLIEPGDIRGDLQSHTDVTDGTAPVEDMAKAAAEKGYQYFAVTDHTKRVTMARGLDENRLRQHADRIRELAKDFKDMWLMAGVEVDILKSGKLDLEEKVLAEMDWVVAAIHYDRQMDEKKMTDRIIAAIASGVVHCLAHPLGRIIGKRDPIRFDLEKVLQACKKHGVWVEINAQPDRLDLPDTYCRQAHQAGVGIAINTDAHKISDLDFMKFGVNVARRAWLEKGDILNTLTAKQLRQKIKRG